MTYIVSGEALNSTHSLTHQHVRVRQVKLYVVAYLRRGTFAVVVGHHIRGPKLNR